MRLSLIFTFLTLVLSSLAHAEPKETIWDSVQPSKAPAPSWAGGKLIKSPSYFDSSSNFGAGTGQGQLDKDHSNVSESFVHFGRTTYNEDEAGHEFGLELWTNGFFELQANYKKFFAPDWKIEPTYTLGVAGIYAPKDQLGNLIDYQRYAFTAGLGLENLFYSHRRFRAEMKAQYGYMGLSFYGLLIYAIPD